MKPYYKTDIRCKRGYKTKRTSQREVRRLEAATLGKAENRISYNAGKKLPYTKTCDARIAHRRFEKHW